MSQKCYHRYAETLEGLAAPSAYRASGHRNKYINSALQPAFGQVRLRPAHTSAWPIKQAKSLLRAFFNRTRPAFCLVTMNGRTGSFHE